MAVEWRASESERGGGYPSPEIRKNDNGHVDIRWPCLKEQMTWDNYESEIVWFKNIYSTLEPLDLDEETYGKVLDLCGDRISEVFFRLYESDWPPHNHEDRVRFIRNTYYSILRDNGLEPNLCLIVCNSARNQNNARFPAESNNVH